MLSGLRVLVVKRTQGLTYYKWLVFIFIYESFVLKLLILHK